MPAPGIIICCAVLDAWQSAAASMEASDCLQHQERWAPTHKEHSARP